MIDPATGALDPDFINTVSALYHELHLDVLPDTRIQRIPLYRSADGRVAVNVTRYPDGGSHSKRGRAGYHECFHVIEGQGVRRTPDGRDVPMISGDLIYVPPDVEIAYRYEPGFADIAFRWSSTALPDHLAGLTPRISG